MVDPEDADYVCTLSAYSVKKAKDELNEDQKERLSAVQALRKWIRQQPHYTCRTDTRFLLNFLRRGKFSQLETRTLIDNFLTARTLYPEYMVNIDFRETSIMTYIEKGVLLSLPKPDKEGRTVFILRLGKVDLNDPKMSVIGQLRSGLAIMELLLETDENLSVNGLVLVYDCTGMEIRHLTRMTTEQKKIVTKIFQENIPIRFKSYNFYNGGALLEMIMAVMKAFLTKKNQERIRTHDTMESLYKVIPKELFPTEYLPDDYTGPSAGSVDSIIVDMKKRMANPELRSRMLANTSDKYKVDESKRPADSTPTESFRKLSVD